MGSGKPATGDVACELRPLQQPAADLHSNTEVGESGRGPTSLRKLLGMPAAHRRRLVVSGPQPSAHGRLTRREKRLDLCHRQPGRPDLSACRLQTMARWKHDRTRLLAPNEPEGTEKPAASVGPALERGPSSSDGERRAHSSALPPARGEKRRHGRRKSLPIHQRRPELVSVHTAKGEPTEGLRDLGLGARPVLHECRERTHILAAGGARPHRRALLRCWRTLPRAGGVSRA